MKPICSPKRCGSTLCVLLLALPLVTGCAGQAKGTVSGKVTYQGKALSSGYVTFTADKGPPLHADIQSDGSYRLENVPVGPVKIGVQPKASQEAMRAIGMPRGPKDVDKVKAAVADRETKLPSKYADPNQSGLTYTVTNGPQQHDIDLK